MTQRHLPEQVVGPVRDKGKSYNYLNTDLKEYWIPSSNDPPPPPPPKKWNVIIYVNYYINFKRPKIHRINVMSPHPW